jgi:hypothetical protein
MRMLMLVALSTLTLGCAHRETRNLAQRQSVTTPRSDFENAPRDDRRERGIQPTEPPIVTPPVP